MEINDIIAIISQIGLPAFICIFFLKRLSIQDDRNHEIMLTMRAAIDNNTEMIKQLIGRLEGWFNGKLD